MGRAALDVDAIRLIEEHHPDIQFDWPQILKGEEEAPPPPPRPARELPRYQPPPREAVAPPPPSIPEPPATSELPREALEPLSAAHARLGSEALARLRGRYADVLAGLGRRVADDQRREQLREQAERLNPDNWVTHEEVSAGLEGYESVLASLRDVIGRRRRRRRGRGTGGGPGAPGPDEAGDRPEEGSPDAAGGEPETDPPADE